MNSTFKSLNIGEKFDFIIFLLL